MKEKEPFYLPRGIKIYRGDKVLFDNTPTEKERLAILREMDLSDKRFNEQVRLMGAWVAKNRPAEDVPDAVADAYNKKADEQWRLFGQKAEEAFPEGAAE